MQDTGNKTQLCILSPPLSCQVDSAWAAGDRVRARQSSRKAKGWSVAGIIFGIALYVVIVIIAIAVNVANNSNYNG